MNINYETYRNKYTTIVLLGNQPLTPSGMRKYFIVWQKNRKHNKEVNTCVGGLLSITDELELELSVLPTSQ